MAVLPSAEMMNCITKESKQRNINITTIYSIHVSSKARFFVDNTRDGIKLVLSVSNELYNMNQGLVELHELLNNCCYCIQYSMLNEPPSLCWCDHPEMQHGLASDHRC